MLTVAPGGNNLATICYKDFLGLATINMYYYYYYYYYRNRLTECKLQLTNFASPQHKQPDGDGELEARRFGLIICKI